MTALAAVLGASAGRWAARSRTTMPVPERLFAGVALAIAAAMVATALDFGGHAREWEGFHWTLAAALGVAIAWRGTSRASGTIRTVRAAGTLALVLWAVGQAASDVEAVFSLTLPVSPQAFFIASIVPGTAAILWAVRERIVPGERLAVRVDALTVFASLVTVIVGVYGSRATTIGGLGGILTLAYPVGFLATAGGGLVTSLATRARLSSYVCLGGAALIGIAWVGWLPGPSGGHAPPGTLSGYLFSFGILGVALGTAAWRPDPSDDPRYRAVAGVLRDLLPSAAVLIIGVPFLNHDPGIETALDAGAGTVIALTLLRQSVLVVERGRLVEREREAHARELEAHRRELEAQTRELEANRRELEAEASLRELASERAAMAGLLARLEPEDDLVATLQTMCDEIAGLSGFDASGVIASRGDGELDVLVTAGYPPRDLEPDLEGVRAIVRDEPSWVGALAKVDQRRLALVPLRGGGAGAVLWAGVREGTSEDWLQSRATLLVEFAALAGTIAGPGLSARSESLRTRREIEAVIARRAFRPVFQPVVELSSGRVVGYEALTRFDDGTPPDVRFAAAADIGLGMALEAATVRAALAGPPPLDAGVWLSVNVSPATVRALTPIAAALEGVEHDVVIEVTEHAAVEDYAQLRNRLRLLSGAIRVAVDDAGAGYASLRHVLELRPSFVKLDIALVRSIDSDPARQGMVAGMCHFASRVGCDLIAEGIETEAELRMLKDLGVRLGQGYLLGRPA